MNRVQTYLDGRSVVISDDVGEVILESRDEVLRIIEELKDLAWKMPVSITANAGREGTGNP